MPNEADMERIKKAKNYYEILGVAETASQQEITKAYRALALKFHPDKYTGPPAGKDEVEEIFKKVGGANDTLKDPDERKKYDARPPEAKGLEPVSLFSSFKNAIKSFCSAVSNFVSSFTSKKENTNEGPKNG